MCEATVINLNVGEYRGLAKWDEDARCYHGDVIGVRDVITFQAEQRTDLEAAMAASLEDYLAFRKT
jgi:predicted HicB family RNase H-like nuclease